MRITVTGASGHIGGNLVRALLDDGRREVRVRALVNQIRAQTGKFPPITIWTKFNDQNPQNTQDQWLASALKDYTDKTGNKVTNVNQPYDQINSKLRVILDEATDKWGVKVTRVDVKNINPPEDVRITMEKQMTAERTRRALVLQAGRRSGLRPVRLPANFLPAGAQRSHHDL